MKALLLSHGFQPEYEAGIANGLAANGVAVELIASDETLFARLDARVDARNLRRSQDPRRSRLAKAANIVRYLGAYLSAVARRRSDVVHTIGAFTTDSIVLSLLEAALVRLLARRFVMTVHNVLPHQRDTRIERAMHRLLYAIPHRLVVHTPRVGERLTAEFGVSAARVVVMEHGIDRFPLLDPVLRSETRARLGVRDEETLVLAFGNLAPYKGLDLLIDAIGRLPAAAPTSLLVAGRCRDAALREAITRQCDASPARSRLHWWERYIGDAEIDAAFLAADVLALPYRHIDQSGVLFMAMAFGLPIVASEVGSLASYVARHAGTIVAVGDVEALAAALQRTPALPWPERAALAAAAQRFAWHRTVRALLPAYGASGAAALDAGVRGTEGSQ